MIRFFRVGVITSLHGLKGEVKVFPTGEEPERFRLYRTVMLGKEGDSEESYVAFSLEGIKQAGKQLVLKLSGVDSPEQARALLKREIYIPREQAVPLEEGEYYIPDLLGCRIVEEDEELGVLTDVLKTGANDVYVCRSADNKELYIPVIPECVRHVSPEEGIIRVKLLPGLRELYL